MHPVMTMKNWGHHLHDDMLRIEHAASMHLHSHRFWFGVGAALLFIALLTLLILWAWRMPAGTFDGLDHMYPYMYYRV